MTRHGWLVPLLGLGVLAPVVYWSQRPTGFQTPAECVDALREAYLDGDVGRYRACLGEPLRSTDGVTPDSLRRQALGLKSWTRHEPVIDGSSALLDVDQVRAGGTMVRQTFRLEQTARGWLIVGLGEPRELRPPVRPGTVVGQEPE